MKLSIYSPQRKLLDEVLVRDVTLTTSEGQIQILPGHANMVGTLETGIFSYSSDGSGDSGEKNQTRGFISTGFFDVSKDHVSVMAEVLELEEEIDVERAEEALKKAQDKLGDPSLPPDEMEKYRLKLARSMVRQLLGGSSKNH